MTFAEVVTTTEGDTSSNITKMIEELTQPEGSEVPKISNEKIPASIVAVVGESSQPKNLSGDLPSLTPRLGKIPDLLIVSILVPRVVTNTIIAAGDVAPARTEEPIIDIGAEDNSLKASEEILRRSLFLGLLRHRKLLSL